jgi:hypothetical protein
MCQVLTAKPALPVGEYEPQALKRALLLTLKTIRIELLPQPRSIKCAKSYATDSEAADIAEIPRANNISIKGLLLAGEIIVKQAGVAATREMKCPPVLNHKYCSPLVPSQPTQKCCSLCRANCNALAEKSNNGGNSVIPLAHNPFSVLPLQLHPVFNGDGVRYTDIQLQITFLGHLFFHSRGGTDRKPIRATVMEVGKFCLDVLMSKAPCFCFPLKNVILGKARNNYRCTHRFEPRENLR